MSLSADLPSFDDEEARDRALEGFVLEELRQRGARLVSVFFLCGFLEPSVCFVAQRSEGLAGKSVVVEMRADEVVRDSEAAWNRAVDRLESGLRRRFPSDRDLEAPLV